MYEELVQNLRGMSKGVCTFDRNNYMCGYFITQQAADAIEELQQIANHYEEESKGWWLAACDAKEERERLKEQIPRWIPVTERLPEDGEDVILTDGKNVSFGYSHNLFSGTEWYIPHGGVGKATHWMPLPEPSKEGE